MANIKSQQKRNRTNAKAHARNVSTRSALRTATRRVLQAVDANDREEAVAALRDASRKLDKAAGSGVIHKNNAANRKSGLAARVNSMPG